MKRLLFLFLALFSVISVTKAQDTEFWFAAPNTSSNGAAFLMLTNVSGITANVSIEIWGGNTTPNIETITIPPGGYFRKNWSSSNEVASPVNLAGTVTYYGMYIASDQSLTGYYAANKADVKDLYAFKGKNALGDNFYVPFQHDHYFRAFDGINENFSPELVNIVVTEDGTDIEFTPLVDCINAGGVIYQRGTTYTITGLNRGQNFMLAEVTVNSQYSLSGSHITSTKPIAVTVSAASLSGGLNAGAGDAAGDQIVPIDKLGSEYIIVKGFTYGYYDQPRDRIYFTGTKDGTQIMLSYEIAGTQIDSLIDINAGETKVFDMGNNYMSGGLIIANDPKVLYAKSNNPVYCFHHSAVGREVGAALVPSIYSIGQNTLSFFQLGLEPDRIEENVAFVIFKDTTENHFTIKYDGNVHPLPITANSVPNISEWKWGKATLPSEANGKHVTIKNDISSISLGYFAYGNIGGMATALYGYLSAYGGFDFGYDTIYRCDANTTLEGGFADSYIWRYSLSENGPYETLSGTSSSIVTDRSGYYVLEMNQNAQIIIDTVYVQILDVKAQILPAAFSPTESQTTFSALIDPALTNDQNLEISYYWEFEEDGNILPPSTEATPTITWPAGESLDRIVRLTITATAKGANSTGSCSATMQTVAVDNISDAECSIDPPSTAFTFNLLASSPGGHGVSNVAVPLVGDIDNDGFTEIVVGDNGFINTKILQIYKLRNNEIVHQQSIHTPAFTNNAVPYAIAKVDDNDYAAIFLCTTYSNNSVDDDRLKLIKYVYNPVTKLYEEFRVGGNTKRGTYSAFSRKEMAQPMIVDFNGDGIPEVVVYDKVYNARTMELLVDGGLLQYAVVADSSAMGFGAGGHGNNNQTIESSSLMAIGDMDNDGIPEVIGGNCVYKVNIVNPNGLSGNSFTLWSRCNKIGPAGEQHDEAVDGTTAIADMDGDGFLDVIVTVARDKSPTGQGCLYIWNPRTGNVMHTDIITAFPITNPGWEGMGISVAFIGDLDNDGQPEVCLTASYRMYAFDFDPIGKRLTQRWERNTGDDSGATTMSMFDFDQDGSVELVYRDQNNLRILNGSDGTDKISVIACSSFTGNEYPVVADVNGDGAADIIVTCGTSVNVYSSNPVGTWAPARRVWNQFSYNVVNVNEDLTIPKYQLHPATVFPGANGILGDGDDIRPYNNYLQQQTVLSPDGIPFWPAPDAEVDSLSSSLTASGNRLTIKACFKNTGDASIGTPIYATMYSDSIGGTIIYVDSVNVQLDVNDNACITFTIPDASTLSGMYNIVIRINDKNGVFPYQPECDEENNVLTFINPLHMTKDAEVLTVFAGNGSYANPVSLLGSETIKYTITAVNPTQNPVTIVVTDTLPAYLGYETGSAAIPGSGFESISSTTGITPQRTILKWKYTLANFKDTKSVTFEAKPVSGAVASQPLFINHATVSIVRAANDTIQHIRTNGTFHQGAGISIMTFSAGLGGEIFNATEQALDYMSTPEAGIIIASEEGYKFAGWSHNGYTSLRGVAIAAQKGIMHYDTLTVYGNVELHADFVPKEESLGEEIEEVEPKTSEATDKVWTVNDELFITTTQAGSIVRIYTTEGVLREQRTIVSAGTTAIKISRGIYIVTINNNIGNKIMIKL